MPKALGARAQATSHMEVSQPQCRVASTKNHTTSSQWKRPWQRSELLHKKWLVTIATLPPLKNITVPPGDERTTLRTHFYNFARQQQQRNLKVVLNKSSGPLATKDAFSVTRSQTPTTSLGVSFSSNQSNSKCFANAVHLLLSVSATMESGYRWSHCDQRR